MLQLYLKEMDYHIYNKDNRGIIPNRIMGQVNLANREKKTVNLKRLISYLKETAIGVYLKSYTKRADMVTLARVNYNYTNKSTVLKRDNDNLAY